MEVNKEHLILAIADLKRAETRKNAAQQDFNEKVIKLRSLCQSGSNDGPTVLTDALRKLGDIHLAEIAAER